MLSSGAHIKIGSVEYTLDESIQGHYRHRFVQPQVPSFTRRARQGIVGLDVGSKAEIMLPDRLVGGMTDWSGGEGNNIFYEDQPTVYRISNGANVRKRGQVTVRPKRTVATLASSSLQRQAYFAVGDGAVWVAQDTQLHYSVDYGATWTTFSESDSGVTGFDADAYITAVAGDEAYVYYAAFEATGTNRRTIKAHQAAAGTSSVVVTAHNMNFPYANLALFDGRLYAWTGRKLWEIDVAETWPIAVTDQTYRKVYDTGTDPATTHTQGNEWTSGMVDAGTSLLFFYSRRLSGGNLYEYKNGVARPIWKAPIGFMMGSIVVKSGVCFINGHWGVGLVSTGTDTVAEGSGQLYAVPLNSLQEINLGKIREFDGDTSGGLLMTRACDSYAGQFMMAGPGTGRIFIYDMASDGVSMLDHLKVAPANGDGLAWVVNPSYRIGDMITVGPKRLVSVFRPGTSASGNIQILTYEDDTPLNRETDGQMASDSTTLNYLEEGQWDDDFPLSPKSLQGIHVSFLVEDAATTSGLLANQRIIVYYSVDGAAYVTAGTITSATAPRGPKGLVFINVAAVTYNQLRIKYAIDNNSTDGVKPPIVYSVLREATLVDWQEEWDLIVRVKDEDDETSPINRRYAGPQIRDYLEDLFQARTDVTLLDGFRYGRHSDPGTYTTHVCKLVAFEDDITKPGEGSCRITLRAKPTTT